MKTFRNNKGQTIGWEKEGVFRKKVQGSKHFLRKPPAIGIDENTYKETEAQEFRIKDTETDNVYIAPREVFEDKGFTQDRGHGLQRFLLIDEFEIKK